MSLKVMIALIGGTNIGTNIVTNFVTYSFTRGSAPANAGPGVGIHHDWAHQFPYSDYDTCDLYKATHGFCSWEDEGGATPNATHGFCSWEDEGGATPNATHGFCSCECGGGAAPNATHGFCSREDGGGATPNATHGFGSGEGGGGAAPNATHNFSQHSAARPLLDVAWDAMRGIVGDVTPARWAEANAYISTRLWLSMFYYVDPDDYTWRIKALQLLCLVAWVLSILSGGWNIYHWVGVSSLGLLLVVALLPEGHRFLHRIDDSHRPWALLVAMACICCSLYSMYPALWDTIEGYARHHGVYLDWHGGLGGAAFLVYRLQCDRITNVRLVQWMGEASMNAGTSANILKDENRDAKGSRIQEYMKRVGVFNLPHSRLVFWMEECMRSAWVPALRFGEHALKPRWNWIPYALACTAGLWTEIRGLHDLACTAGLWTEARGLHDLACTAGLWTEVREALVREALVGEAL